MSNEIIDSLESLKTFVLNAKNTIDEKDKIILELKKKYEDLDEEFKNLRKVSLVASLSKQLDNKNSEIEILQKQLHKARAEAKENSKKSSKSSVKSEKESITKLEEEDSDDEDEIKIEEGYELIEHDDIKLLKNMETRKLYFLVNGKKGKYAGKQSKKGKIKLK